MSLNGPLVNKAIRDHKALACTMALMAHCAHMDLMTIRVRNVPNALVADIKRQAQLAGMTMSAWVVEVLRADVRGTGSSESGKAGRGGKRATVPNVPGATSEAIGLHEVQPVRSELADGGGSDSGPEARPLQGDAPRSHEGHKTYKYGNDKHWCSDCHAYF